MRLNWTDSFLLFAAAGLVCLLHAQPMLAQHGGPPGAGSSPGAGAGSVGSAGSIGTAGTRGTTSSIPGMTPGTGNGTYGTTNNPYNTRPIFLSGKVMFDDGSPTNANIRVERVCGGNVRLEAHTDSKGGFSFQVGENPTVDTDAADDSPANMGRAPGSPASLGAPETAGQLSGTRAGANPLWNCELRASYPGYLSDNVDLANRRSLDDPNVGTIILRRAGNVKGSTVSLTSAEAPKKAQKNYEKGCNSRKKVT